MLLYMEEAGSMPKQGSSEGKDERPPLSGFLFPNPGILS